MVNRLGHKALRELTKRRKVTSQPGRADFPTYSDAFGPAHVIRCQSGLGRHYSLFLLWLQVQGVSFWLLLQRGRCFLWQLGDRNGCLFWLIQSIQSSWFSLIELLLCGEMQQVLNFANTRNYLPIYTKISNIGTTGSNSESLLFTYLKDKVLLHF